MARVLGLLKEAGLSGVGGAVIATPILTSVFGTSQVVAQGLSLALAAPSTGVTLVTYALHHQVNWSLGLPLAVCPPAGFAPKEAGLAGALRLLARAAGRKGFDFLVSGASDLDDAGGAADFRRVGAGLGLRVETPAAALDVPDAVVECARLGVKAVIVGTERAVDPRWLGREFGMEFCEYILRLRARGVKVDGNDFQTLVTDSPAFSAPVELLRTRPVRLRDRCLLKVLSFRAGRAVVTNAV